MTSSRGPRLAVKVYTEGVQGSHAAMATPPLHRLPLQDPDGVDGLLDELPLELLREVEDRIEYGAVDPSNCATLTIRLDVYHVPPLFPRRADVTVKLESRDGRVFSSKEQQHLSTLLLGVLAGAGEGVVQDQKRIRMNDATGLLEERQEKHPLSAFLDNEEFIERHSSATGTGSLTEWVHDQGIAATYKRLMLPLPFGRPAANNLYTAEARELAIDALYEAMLQAFRSNRDHLTFWIPEGLRLPWQESWNDSRHYHAVHRAETSVRLCSDERTQRRASSNTADDTPGYLERRVNKRLLTRHNGPKPRPALHPAPWPAPGQPGGQIPMARASTPRDASRRRTVGPG